MAKSPPIVWPEGKRFAFTILDDTDGATVENVKPVYDLLHRLGMRTTKTVWVYPSRDRFTGGTIVDHDYLQFVRLLQSRGFEIAFHGVGSGLFKRAEILDGLERHRELLGDYPHVHANHSKNHDSIYWGYQRYVFPMRQIISLIYGEKRRFHGDDEQDGSFWGDACKRHIKYIRNHVFSGINTLRYDRHMPYRDRSKEKYSNYWFSSSNGARLELFNSLLAKDHVDQLVNQGGACIVYTHFASQFVTDGKVDPEFERRLTYLASFDGWFVPVTNLLDFIYVARGGRDVYPTWLQLASMDFVWLLERCWRRVVYRE